MESASSRNKPDIQALRVEYNKLGLELRTGPQNESKATEVKKVPKGVKAKLTALLGSIGNILKPDDTSQEVVLQEIQTAEKILVFAQKPEIAELSMGHEKYAEWKKCIELMQLAQRRIRIFSQEVAAAQKEMDQAIGRRSPNDALKAHGKRTLAENQVKENTQSLNSTARKWLIEIEKVLEIPHS